jgi:pimeloyl-ACP methyl ester carboxylesterase
VTEMTTSPAGPTHRPFPPLEGVTHRFVTVRGVRFHVAEAGAGPPVLLLHGFPQHWYAWRHVIPGLSGRYQLICPDLRGFGWSDAPADGYDTTNRVDDVLALMDALGLERVRLIAHQWGARTGFLLCLRAPERFSHYLALNMVHPWPSVARSLPHAWRYGYTVALEVPRLGPWTLRHRPGFVRGLLCRGVTHAGIWQVEDLEEYARSTQEPARARAGAALHRQYAMRDLVPILLGRHRSQRLTVPTRILAGADDFALAPAMLAGGDRFADDLRVQVVPGCGHYLAEERPDLVIQAALDLFER